MERRKQKGGNREKSESKWKESRIKKREKLEKKSKKVENYRMKETK